MSKKTPNSKAASQPSASTKPRRLKAPVYRSFKLQSKVAKPQTLSLTGGSRLLRRSFGLLGRNWKVFSGLAGIYAVLSLLLVQGFFNVDLVTAQANAQSLAAGQWSTLLGGVGGLSYLFTNAGADPTTGAYRVILLMIVSLAAIWTLRQAVTHQAEKKIRVRDAFYQGMYPLVPFMLVSFVITLQLVPLTIALYLVSMVGVSGGIEMVLWSLVLLSVSAFTIYMLSSSVFALYITCLPDMTPMAALRAAIQLVKHRRWTVVRRLIFLPFVLVLGLTVIMVPLIIIFPPIALVVFFIFLMTAPIIAHGYLYGLYRELLHE